MPPHGANSCFDYAAGQAKQCHTKCDIAACHGGGHPSLDPPLRYATIKRKKAKEYKTDPKIYISLRTTDSVKKRISEQAKLLNIVESEYVRRAIVSALSKGDKLFRTYTGPKVYIVDEKLRQELNRIGVNINQIAYALNAANLNNDNVSLADVFEQLVKLTEELECVRNKLGKEGQNVL